jgi:hypothetical protein
VSTPRVARDGRYVADDAAAVHLRNARCAPFAKFSRAPAPSESAAPSAGLQRSPSLLMLLLLLRLRGARCRELCGHPASPFGARRFGYGMARPDVGRCHGWREHEYVRGWDTPHEDRYGFLFSDLLERRKYQCTAGVAVIEQPGSVLDSFMAAAEARANSGTWGDGCERRTDTWERVVACLLAAHRPQNAERAAACEALEVVRAHRARMRKMEQVGSRPGVEGDRARRLLLREAARALPPVPECPWRCDSWAIAVEAPVDARYALVPVVDLRVIRKRRVRAIPYTHSRRVCASGLGHAHTRRTQGCRPGVRGASRH